MAPSHNQDTQVHEYTQKIINSGNLHKKLVLRLKRKSRQEDGIPSETITQHDDISNSSKSNLFRPYTQNYNDDDSPERFTRYSLDTQTAKDYASHWLYYYLYAYPSVQQSEEEYALKLQRQRSALFMKYVLQFYETGNGWPSVHPNIQQHHFNNNFKS